MGRDLKSLALIAAALTVSSAVVSSSAGGMAGSARTDIYTDTAPVWSPDGTRVAFVRHFLRTGRSRVYVVPSNRAGARPLATASGSTLDPTWSPDGDRLALTRARRLDGRAALRVEVVGREGRVRRVLINASQPSWSPDGEWLAFRQPKGRETGIYVARVDGGYPRLVSTVGNHLEDRAWSHDGVTLATEARARVYTFDPSGGLHARRDRGAGYIPSWSPTARRLAAVVGNRGCSVAVIEEHETLPANRGCPHLLRIASVAWSPDGSRLAAIVCWGAECGLRILDPTSGRQAYGALVCATAASWSPDGSRLVVASSQPDRETCARRRPTSLYVVRADDGTVVRRLTGGR